MSRVIVHIDRLVLRGFRVEDRHRIAAGLQQELEQVLANRVGNSQWNAIGNAPSLKVSGLRIANRSTPQRIGETVGHGIGKELRK